MSSTDTRNYPFEIAPGGMFQISVSGAKFLVRSTTAPVNVRWSGGYLANMEGGQGYNVRKGFSSLVLTNDNALTIVGSVLIEDDDFIDNRVSGEVALNIGTAYTQTNPAIATATGAILAANPLRKYTLIQNNHGTATVYLGFDVPATVAGGVKIVPGGSYESNLSVHRGAINAIGDAANALVVVLEG